MDIPWRKMPCVISFVLAAYRGKLLNPDGTPFTYDDLDEVFFGNKCRCGAGEECDGACGNDECKWFWTVQRANAVGDAPTHIPKNKVRARLLYAFMLLTHFELIY